MENKLKMGEGSSISINSAEKENIVRHDKLIKSNDQMEGCFTRFRRSNQLVVVVNFFSMVTGIMVVSVLQPILPDLLDVIWRQTYMSHSTTPAPTTTKPPGIAWNNDFNQITTTASPVNATFPNKSFIIGSLLGFAPLVEIFFTPVAVLAIKWLGFKKPMIAACLLQLFGCYAIAYANILALLYAARITQAIAVIFATVAGFSLIAVRFEIDEERSHALTTSMHGFPIGILIAYPCGTALYSYFGVAMPFVIISAMSIFCTVLVLFISESDQDRECQQKDSGGSSYCKLMCNPAILLSLVMIAYSWCIVFLLGATTPNRMQSVLKAESWEIGLVLFVSTLAQIITSGIVGKLAGRVNRWLVTLIGNVIACVGLVSYPFCTSIYHTIGPETAVRIGWGLVTSSMGPLLGTLVDQSQGMAYIRVYALFMSFNLFGAFAGSLVGGWLDGIIGFSMLYWGASVVTFVVSIVGFCLTFCLQKDDDDIFEETLPYIVPEYQPLLDSRSHSQSLKRRHFSSSYQYPIA